MIRGLALWLCLGASVYAQGLPYELSSRPQLPTHPRHEAFRKVWREVDGALKEAQGVRLVPHEDGDGTSCYVYLEREGKRLGLLMPADNESGNIETEANMWSLLRVFEQCEIGQPAGYVTLGPWAQAELLRVCGCDEHAGERYLFKWFDNSEFTEWEDPLIGYHLDPDFVLTRLLASDGRPPTARPLTVKGRTTTELSLARQFSTALLADRIQGEWDRWIGTNIHVHFWNGQPHLAWYDNGGANFEDVDDGGTFERFVHRFDAVAAERVRGLDNFLTGVTESFLGFTREDDLRAALNIYSQTSWEGFRHNLHEVRTLIDERAITADAYLR